MSANVSVANDANRTGRRSRIGERESLQWQLTRIEPGGEAGMVSAKYFNGN
jgi:hypothetical protein